MTTISGTTKDAGGNPVARTVRANRLDTGVLLGAASSAEVDAVAGDEHYDKVVLLVRANGSDGSTTFTDESPSPKTITANGNAQIDTAVKKYGSGSLLLDGNGDWLSLADSAAWTFGTGDFTVETWAYFLANPASSSGDFGYCLIGQTAVSNASRGWMLFIAGSSLSSCAVRGVVYSGSTEYKAEGTGRNLSLNTWYHLAMCRDGNTLRMYLGGVQIGTVSITGVTVNDSAQPLMIGRFNDSGYTYYVNGHMDDICVTKGVCRYPGGTTFTPPAMEALANLPVAANALGSYSIDCGGYTGDVIVYQYDPADLTIRPQIHISEPV